MMRILIIVFAAFVSFPCQAAELIITQNYTNSTSDLVAPRTETYIYTIDYPGGDGTFDFSPEYSLLYRKITIENGLVTNIGIQFLDTGQCDCVDFYRYNQTPSYDSLGRAARARHSVDYGDGVGSIPSGYTLFSLEPPKVTIDGVRIGVAPLPEPSVWALLVVGFGMCGLGLRRKGLAQFA